MHLIYWTLMLRRKSKSSSDEFLIRRCSFFFLENWKLWEFMYDVLVWCSKMIDINYNEIDFFSFISARYQFVRRNQVWPYCYEGRKGGRFSFKCTKYQNYFYIYEVYGVYHDHVSSYLFSYVRLNKNIDFVFVSLVAIFLL